MEQESLDFLITQSNLLNERLIILRYKVYEEKQIKDSYTLSDNLKKQKSLLKETENEWKDIGNRINKQACGPILSYGLS